MPEQLVKFDDTLTERFYDPNLDPDRLTAFYETCMGNASKHTGPDKPFLLAPTDLATYPDQSIDCQYVPAQGWPIESILKLAGDFSPGIGDDIPVFAEENELTLRALYQALKEGYNVLETVPTHSLPHDIALPGVKITAALVEIFGTEADQPAKRAHIFGKPLHWYVRDGLNAPFIASAHAGVFSVIPNSRSGGKFDKDVRKAYNQRAVAQRDWFLSQGGARLILSPGGATNTPHSLLGKVVAECQAPISEGTGELMTDERNLILPEACYVDAQGKVQVRLGNLDHAETLEDCFAIGKWGARQYKEMSGRVTWQAKSPGQREAFRSAKAEDIIEAARHYRLGQLLTRHERDTTEENLTNEQPDSL